MSKQYTFPEQDCWSCPNYKVVGGITRYCAGFKRRKPKRFSSSDPKIKAPKWCPRRISPPACRIYHTKDDCSEYMEMLSRLEYDSGRSKSLQVSAHHFKLKKEIPLGMTAKRFFDATQAEPLSDILPEEVEIGEIIEIDDGLKPYFFYALNYDAVVPLPYFYFPQD